MDYAVTVDHSYWGQFYFSPSLFPFLYIFVHAKENKSEFVLLFYFLAHIDKICSLCVKKK